MNISDKNKIYNTYNLIVVGLCKSDRIADFVKYFKNEIYSSFKEHADFYNLDTLGRAEVDSTRLNKTSKMTFRCSDDLTKTFIGFSINRSIEERYKTLFGPHSGFDLKSFLTSMPESSKELLLEKVKERMGTHTQQYEPFPHNMFDHNCFPTPLPKFSKELLLQKLKEKFGIHSLHSEPFLLDIDVSFKTVPTEDSRIYTEIKCSVSPNLELPFNVKDRFISITEKADSLFPAEFCSAYISYAPEEISVAHTALCFRYDRQKVFEYILGGEWFVYMGKKIKNKLNTEILTAISKYAFVTEYENGISYKADCEITDFDKYRSYYHSLLNNLLIPAYGEISWEQLTKGSTQYAARPSKLYVFNNNMIGKFGPDIVLAHNCSVKDVCRYHVRTEENLIFSLNTNEN